MASGGLMAMASSTQSHHPWPMYLGGPEKQSLLKVPTKLHEKYHAGLDKIFSRFNGSMKWSELTDAQKSDVLSRLRDYTQRFDSDSGTRILDSLEDVLKAAGAEQ